MKRLCPYRLQELLESKLSFVLLIELVRSKLSFLVANVTGASQRRSAGAAPPPLTPPLVRSRGRKSPAGDA